MIHIENRQLRMDGSPVKPLGEAATGLKGAVNGFYTLSKRVEKDEARARELTEKMMETAFKKVREGAFEEVDNLKIEDKPCSVPEL